MTETAQRGRSEELEASDIRCAARNTRMRVLEHTIGHGGYLSQACSSAEVTPAAVADLLQRQGVPR